MIKRGHKITKETGNAIAADMRKRRFEYDAERSQPRRVGTENLLITVKTNAAVAARNTTTGAMASVQCRMYITQADGTEVDSGQNIKVFNPGGAVASGTWMKVILNMAYQYEFVVARCGS